jgi:hypothetical protein
MQSVPIISVYILMLKNIFIISSLFPLFIGKRDEIIKKVLLKINMLSEIRKKGGGSWDMKAKITYVVVYWSTIIKRKFKKWWSTMSQIST